MRVEAWRAKLWPRAAARREDLGQAAAEAPRLGKTVPAGPCCAHAEPRRLARVTRVARCAAAHPGGPEEAVRGQQAHVGEERACEEDLLGRREHGGNTR